jgi:hypothetical protein
MDVGRGKMGWKMVNGRWETEKGETKNKYEVQSSNGALLSEPGFMGFKD